MLRRLSRSSVVFTVSDMHQASMLVMTAGTFCEWHFMANLCRVIKLRESNYTGSAHAQTKRQKPVGHADCRYKMSILLRVFMACNIQLFVRTITQ